MSMITVTQTKVNFQTVSNLKRGIATAKIENLRPSTEGNLSTAAIFEAVIGDARETWYVSETYSAVLAAIVAADQEAGAELTANKATTFGTINDTLYPSVEAVVEVAQPIWYAATSGTDTYTATLTGIVPTAYYAGMQVKLLFGNTNTGAATINLNSLGAKAITKGTAGTTALSASDLVVTKIYTLIYDGTRFQIDL